MLHIRGHDAGSNCVMSLLGKDSEGTHCGALFSVFFGCSTVSQAHAVCVHVCLSCFGRAFFESVFFWHPPRPRGVLPGQGIGNLLRALLSIFKIDPFL